MLKRTEGVTGLVVGVSEGGEAMANVTPIMQQPSRVAAVYSYNSIDYITTWNCITLY